MSQAIGQDRAFRRLAARCEGNISVLFAVSLMALIIACGAAIDYGRYLASKTALQAAVDAAALQVSASDSTDESEMKSLAETVLQDTYQTGSYGELGETDLTISDDTLLLSVEAQLPSTFMGLVGVSEVTLERKAEISRTSTNLEVALVIDTTDSMTDLLSTIKEEALSLAETIIEKSDSTAKARVAVIPFDEAVNVGTHAGDARGPIASGTCYTAGCENYIFRNYNGNYKTFSWTNCVTERTGNYAYTDDPPSKAYVGRFYQAPGQPRCPNSILPLTDDLESIEDLIDDLQVKGKSAGQVGIAWGWFALSPTFGIWTGDSAPDSYDTDTRKIMVILTDGDFNIQYCNEIYSSETTVGKANKTTCAGTNGTANAQAAQLCTSIKAKGIIIYTIGFNLTDGSSMEELLSNCASGETYALLPDTTSELVSTFQQIAEELTTVRVSQ